MSGAASTKERTEHRSIRRVLKYPGADVATVESAALLVGSAFFVLGGLVALILFWGQDLPISGQGSLGEYAAIGGAVAALLAFIAGRYVADRTPNPALQREIGKGLSNPDARLHWFDVASLSIAHGVIALLGWTALATVLELCFRDAVVFSVPAAALGGVTLALSAYVSFLSSVRMTPMLLSLVLAVFLVVGVLASMLSASDDHWWKENLSALGMTDDVSALAFNVTLIIAGAIVTIVARYATGSLPTTDPAERKGRDTVRLLLILVGIFLACVGIFKVDEFFWVHNSVATGMAICFAIIVIRLPWLVHSVPRVFVLLGYAYLLVIAVVAVFFAIGYYNLTAVELVAACLIFSWIIVFLRTAGASGAAEADAAEQADQAAAAAE
ncbi:hypothetical membrane protein [Agromyces sp. CF514]|uniref:DUF998 domain-containing protein n=1 Tax=Agromyces sp. CF514 TaxID=1881031 RepID=UPI0008E237D5|nr:DUF998 domain-containing protein [Agromyces sp. CF514]SFR66407.1 hypothetical membrane protein [Agromyces sp. CF514]